MGLLDTLKATADRMKGKAGDFVQQHEDKIERGLDKAAKTVDTKTKGKYSGKIETGTGKAKDALGRLSHKDTEGGTRATRPEAEPGAEPGSGPESGAGGTSGG